MELLKKEFNRKGLSYKQIKRNDKVAMYSVSNGNVLYGYEVFRIRKQEASETRFKGKLVRFVEKEVLPNEQEFGFESGDFDKLTNAESYYLKLSEIYSRV